MGNALDKNQRKDTKTVWNTTLKSPILITITGKCQPCIVLSGEDSKRRMQFEAKRNGRSKLKKELRKRCAQNLPSGSASWICETCGKVLHSKAGYLNHLKSLENNPQNTLIRPQFETTTCDICNKLCKSISGLKKHMNIHNTVLLQPARINPVKITFVCHLCYRPCKSAAGLRSHLRTHGREKNPIDENWGGNHLERCCNNHVCICMYVYQHLRHNLGYKKYNVFNVAKFSH